MREMAVLGLEVARTQPDPAQLVFNLEGVLAGTTEGEIVIGAHYDTVASSPGALDDASGCAVALAALQELSRMPLRRTLRVVFFDAEEQGLQGSRLWASSLSEKERQGILAGIVLDMVGEEGSRRPLILDLGVAADGPGAGSVSADRESAGLGRGTKSPAWLVHSALRAGEASGFPLSVASARQSLATQILMRSVTTPFSSDRRTLLAAGIPAVLLSDFSVHAPSRVYHSGEDTAPRLSAQRLGSWSLTVAALVRRLDALEGRPRWEDEYLVWARRVWIRRDLMWVGFLLWVAMIFRMRPGRWAGVSSEERRLRGRVYLPGFLFRGGFLGVTLWFPAVGGPLIYPLALAALVKPSSPRMRGWLQIAAMAPTAFWLGMISVAVMRGTATAYKVGWTKTGALLVVLTAFSWQLWQVGRPSLLK